MRPRPLFPFRTDSGEGRQQQGPGQRIQLPLFILVAVQKSSFRCSPWVDNINGKTKGRHLLWGFISRGHLFCFVLWAEDIWLLVTLQDIGGQDQDLISLRNSFASLCPPNRGCPRTQKRARVFLGVASVLVSSHKRAVICQKMPSEGGRDPFGHKLQGALYVNDFVYWKLFASDPIKYFLGARICCQCIWEETQNTNAYLLSSGIVACQLHCCSRPVRPVECLICCTRI